MDVPDTGDFIFFMNHLFVRIYSYFFFADTVTVRSAGSDLSSLLTVVPFLFCVQVTREVAMTEGVRPI